MIGYYFLGRKIKQYGVIELCDQGMSSGSVTFELRLNERSEGNTWLSGRGVPSLGNVPSQKYGCPVEGPAERPVWLEGNGSGGEQQ